MQEEEEVFQFILSISQLEQQTLKIVLEVNVKNMIRKKKLLVTALKVKIWSGIQTKLLRTTSPKCHQAPPLLNIQSTPVPHHLPNHGST